MEPRLTDMAQLVSACESLSNTNVTPNIECFDQASRGPFHFILNPCWDVERLGVNSENSFGERVEIGALRQRKQDSHDGKRSFKTHRPRPRQPPQASENIGRA